MTIAGALLDDLARRLGPEAVTVDAPLGALTTYRVGGSAAVLVTVESSADVREVANVVAAAPEPPALLTIGRGSNMLVADTGFDGIAVQLGDGLAGVEVDGTVLVAGGAANLPVAARFSAKAGLTGFEWAVGVPGTIGGGVAMNAGGHGSEIATNLAEATLIDLATGATRTVGPADLELAYRSSNVRRSEVVVSASFQLETGDAEASKAELSEIVRWRLDHQPGGQNAGSVFTNPPGDSAGRLIDAAGLKGLRVGSAEISTKHANFIQADPDGNASDVFDLMTKVIDTIAAQTGIVLHPETRLVGFA